MAGKYEAETPNKWIHDPQVRQYVYRVLAAAGPVALLYGVLTAEQIAVWLGLAGTVLATPAGALAAANVPKKASS
jgi:hypothetical protein